MCYAYIKIGGSNMINQSEEKEFTESQEVRQSTRENGKYSSMGKCENCGKPVGHKYYSADNWNEVGKGFMLCRKCCIAQNKEYQTISWKIMETNHE